MIDFSALLQGFMLGFGMFICPGPKDVVIIRESLAGRSPVVLITIGAGCDMVLIALGILGLSAAFQSIPSLEMAATLLGILLLVFHGLSAARSALRAGRAEHSTGAPPCSGKGGLEELLMISLLNPATWLDTVLVIGTTGVALAPERRLSYSIGAVSASCVWFVALVLASHKARTLMTSPRNWRILDSLVSIAMLLMAAWLAWGL
ncbi:LysE/ArgO family amino acid transporter [Herbaspirillum seropedicae]|uniref:LysE/ArgO family amino acid transporter n=1 Tax=Herbaspirillum seropedicae TaxID=964 RepID=UPI002861BFA0|nr:LysE family transporter [Herbaspirillum seropedicae]MDR6396588.1 L-lysine exporter family protein LysE/ArgO [Herbaspirillum seropedicae]